METDWTKRTLQFLGMTVVLVVLLIPIHFGVKALVHKVCAMGTTREDILSNYEKRAIKVRRLWLSYADATKDKSLLTRNGINLRNAIFEFPRDDKYTLDNVNNIERELRRQSKTIQKTGEIAVSTVATICGIVDFQVVVFLLAIFHTIITGKLLEKRTWVKTLRTELEEWPSVFVNMASHVANNSSSILMTIGIGGTFWGLLTGLVNATPLHIHSFNLTALFLGLKISFISTLAGILLSLVTRIVQQGLFGQSETIESVAEKIDKLRTGMDTAIKRSVRKAVKVQHKWTFEEMSKCTSRLDQCSTQLGNAHQELDSCIQEVGKHKTAIKEANKHLNTIETTSRAYLENIEAINSIIARAKSPSEDIGSALNGIHEAMKRHMEMESKYIESIENIQTKLVQALKNPQSSFQELADSLKDVDKRMALLLDAMKTTKRPQ